MIRNRRKKKGFTLIELIIVIAIIAILAAIAIPKFGDIRRNAALKSDVANAKVIANGASALIADGTIEVPASSQTVEIDKSKTDAIADKIEGYLQNIPTPESSGYTKYKVTIDEKGNVKVTMNNGSKDFKLYPETDTTTP